MLTIYHLKHEDLDIDIAFRLSAPFGSKERPAIASAHLLEGHYEAVATVALNDTMQGLETAYTMTQNGVLSETWSREPPSGLTPLEPTVHLQEGRVYGRRSTMIGDVIECRDGDNVLSRHVVDTFGFVSMPPPVGDAT